MGEHGFHFETKSSYAPGMKIISAMGLEGVYLYYFFDKKSGCWNFEDMQTEPHDNAGLGKALVSEFIQNVGPGQKLFLDAVIEPETRNKLIELGYFQKAKEENKAIEITDEDTIKQLKLARVFQGGGATIDMVSVRPFDKDPDLIDGWWIGVRMYGHT